MREAIHIGHSTGGGEVARYVGRHGSALDCIKAFSETDFTEDLKKIDVPTLVLHGDGDQIVPIGASALCTTELVRGATLKVMPGLSHGMCTVNKDQVNAELLGFIRSEIFHDGGRGSPRRGGSPGHRSVGQRTRRDVAVSGPARSARKTGHPATRAAPGTSPPGPGSPAPSGHPR